MHDFLRPWKLATFAIGLALLIAGSFYYNATDWDIGISVIMASMTYLLAPWAARVIWTRRWKFLPLALLAWVATVDTSYYIYHTLMGNEMLRLENFYASTALFWLCGFIWLHDGTLREALDRRNGIASVTKSGTE